MQSDCLTQKRKGQSLPNWLHLAVTIRPGRSQKGHQVIKQEAQVGVYFGTARHHRGRHLGNCVPGDDLFTKIFDYHSTQISDMKPSKVPDQKHSISRLQKKRGYTSYSVVMASGSCIASPILVWERKSERMEDQGLGQSLQMEEAVFMMISNESYTVTMAQSVAITSDHDDDQQ